MSMTYCGLDKDHPHPRIVCRNPASRVDDIKCNWCEVARCCRSHGHENCSDCDEFVCELLLQFAVGPNGDGGARVQALNAVRRR